MAAALEQTVLLELEKSWHVLNERLFGRAMTVPVIMLTEGRLLGQYDRSARLISLQRELALRGDWSQAIEVLKHEMAHQFVADVLSIDEPPHGPAFRRVCQQRSIDSRAAGLPSVVVSDRSGVVDRVRKLLALAQSDNRHEAQLAMTSAQRLMLKHNINRVNDSDGHYVSATVGGAQLRMAAWRKQLASILNRHFFVSVIIGNTYVQRSGKKATVIEIVGSPENVEIAHYAHDFLVNTGERLWREYAPTRSRKRRTDKAQFLMGFVLGFSETLDAARTDNEQFGLVWMGDEGLGQYFQKRYPRVVRGRARRIYGSPALSEGQVQGRKTIMSHGLTQAKKGVRRLLT